MYPGLSGQEYGVLLVCLHSDVTYIPGMSMILGGLFLF